MTAIVRGALWANDLTWLPGPVQVEPGDGYHLAEIRSEEPVAHLIRAMDLDGEDVRRRLDRGRRAFGAWLWPDGELGAWLWVSVGSEWAPPIERDLHFADDECYAWDAGSRPEHRGHGLFTRLLVFAGARMASEGRRFMWGGILDANTASQRSNAGAGFRPILRLTAVHEASRSHLRTRPADYADLRLVERARHVLRVGVEGKRIAAA